MPATLPTPTSPVPARGLAGRVVGVLTSPRATYADIAARPASLGVLAVVLVATLVPLMWLLSTAVGQRAVIDQQLQTVEAFGGAVSDAQYAQLERMAPYARYFAAATQIVGLPLMVLLVAGVAFAIFNGARGADAPFRPVLANVAISSVV
jgi:hypothetical protein